MAKLIQNEPSEDKSKRELAKLPPPEVYELEYIYWPWGKLIKFAVTWIETNAKPSGFILDYMCGTAYLLNEVTLRRGDLVVRGCSLTPSFIEYAKRAYPRVDVIFQDAMDYKPNLEPDIVICTGGLHHLDRAQQPMFIKKVASELMPGKHFLLGEALIRWYENENDRRLAVLELSFSVMSYVIQKNAPEEVIEAVAEVLLNDLFERGEYKVTHHEITMMLEPYFNIVSIHHFWPDSSMLFGDFLFICQRK